MNSKNNLLKKSQETKRERNILCMDIIDKYIAHYVTSLLSTVVR